MVNADHGGVSSMGSSEGVIDVDVPKGSKLLSEIGNLSFVGFDLLAILDTLAFFLKVVPEILKKEDLSVGWLRDGLLDFLANAVIKEFHLMMYNRITLYFLS